MYIIKIKLILHQLSTYEALTKPELKGKVLIRKANNIYNQSLLASMVANDGEKSAKAWAKAMVNNFARTPKGSDRDQMKAVAANVGDVAVVNTYYVGKLLNSKKRTEVEVGKKMGVFFQIKMEMEHISTFLVLELLNIVKIKKMLLNF